MRHDAADGRRQRGGHGEPARHLAEIDERDRVDGAEMLADGAALPQLDPRIAGPELAHVRADRARIGHHAAEEAAEEPGAARQRAQPCPGPLQRRARRLPPRPAARRCRRGHWIRTTMRRTLGASACIAGLDDGNGRSPRTDWYALSPSAASGGARPTKATPSNGASAPPSQEETVPP